MEAIGNHFIIELYECEGDIKTVEHVGEILREAAIKCKATVVSEFFQQFQPWGVSGVIILAESHISIHTWPELKYCAVDFFFCDISNIDVEAGIQHIKDGFVSQRVNVDKLDRGLNLK